MASTHRVPARSDVEQQFVESFDQLAKSLAGRFGCPLEDAEDAVQIAFMRLLEHQPKGNIGGWLRTVAKHELVHRYRRLKREPLGATLDKEIAPDVDEPLDASHTLSLIRQLKRRQRLCLLMQALGFSYDEIQRADRSDPHLGQPPPHRRPPRAAHPHRLIRPQKEISLQGGRTLPTRGLIFLTTEIGPGAALTARGPAPGERTPDARPA